MTTTPSTNYHVIATAAVTDEPDLLFSPIGDLTLSMVYAIGLLDGADGSDWFPVRGFFTDTTRSARPMEAVPGGDYAVAPEGLACYAGPVAFGGTDGRWGFRPPVGPPLLTLKGSALHLVEEGFLELEGEAVGPACRWSSSLAEHPLAYTSRAYRVRGLIRDTPVEGIYFIDLVHARPGQSLLPSPYVDRMQVAWCSFANENPDGTWESGVLVAGTDGYQAVSVQHDGRPLIATGDLDSATYRIENGSPAFPEQVQIGAGGETFTWRAASGGRWPLMSHYAADHRMRRGTVSRAGAAGTPRRSFALLEGYVDRMSAATP